MRKFLWVVAVGTLVLVLAAPAIALDFKFGSEYRVRFYSYINAVPGGVNSFNDEAPGNNPRGVQTRLRPRFDVSDDNGNITATLRLEIGDIEWGAGGGAASPANAGNASGTGQPTARVGNGAGGGAGVDGVNVETKWAYIDAAFPFGIPLRARAGLQGWFLPKGLIMDDDAAGLRLYGTVKPVSYEAAWFRVDTGTAPAGTTATNVSDNNYDFWQFKVDAAIAPWLNPGAYFLYGMNKATTVGGSTPAETIYIGFTATGKVGIVSYDFDFVYGFAEGGPLGNQLGDDDFRDVTGWAFDAGVHFPIGPLTLHVVGSASSGDERDGGDSEAFPTILPSWNGPGGLFHMVGSGGPFDVVDVTQDAPTNLWSIGLVADYRPVKALLTQVGYAYVSFMDKKGNCSVVTVPATTCVGPSYAALAGDGGEDYLGHEIFVRADYDVWTGFKVQGMAGWLIPSAGDTAHEYILQLLYNF